MNAAPAGARRGRIYAPLGIYASVAKLRPGRHECRPYNQSAGTGGMNAAPTIFVGGAFMRP